jgi:hypothetical protein
MAVRIKRRQSYQQRTSKQAGGAVRKLIVVEQVKKMKADGGPDLHVHGSGNLIQMDAASCEAAA